MKAVKEKAYAKINLYLNVVGKREDGFHDIETVMHSLNLSDDVTVMHTSSGKRSVRVIVNGNRRLPTDSKNLVYSAAELYLSRLSLSEGVTVKLDKRIPISAGLAGGSSDAAATLRAINKLFGRLVTDKALIEMAAELGSDVPYCLVGGTAFCTRRGENICRLTTDLSLYAVVAVDNEYVSTPEAYAALDERFSDFSSGEHHAFDEYRDALFASLRDGRLPSVGLYNIFEQVVLPRCPGAMRLREELVTLGARYALMSGSGPSVFGVFDNRDFAVCAVEKLTSRGIRAFYAETVK